MLPVKFKLSADTEDFCEDDEEVFDKVYENVCKRNGNCVCVVGNSCYKSSYGDLCQLVVRKIFDVMEKVLTDVGNYSLTGLLENDRLEIGRQQ